MVDGCAIAKPVLWLRHADTRSGSELYLSKPSCPRVPMNLGDDNDDDDDSCCCLDADNVTQSRTIAANLGPGHCTDCTYAAQLVKGDHLLSAPPCERFPRDVLWTTGVVDDPKIAYQYGSSLMTWSLAVQVR
jgi:hypothetical protein